MDILFYFKLSIFCVVFWVIVEFTLHFLIRFLRNHFQWLITSADEYPDFPEKGLKKFFVHGYDPELGWVRKPGTSGEESSKSAGDTSSAHKTTKYSINAFGARSNPGHEDLPLLFSTYGDSFVFSRQVNDNQTWQYHLSELTQSNVQNFGVGNYGLDQALLRLRREYQYNRSPVVFLGVVPETICRILSVWKHYCEYGNTFAFKPRFELRDKELFLVENVIDCKEKFQQLKEHLSHLQQHDFFYQHKFKKDMLTFPYSYSLFKSRDRNIPLIISLLQRHVLTREKHHCNGGDPWRLILKRNFDLVHDLFQHTDHVSLFLEILRNFKEFGRHNNFKPVFLLMPYLQDLLYTRKNGCYYSPFIESAKQILPVIDLTDTLLAQNNLEELYLNDFYGGHLNVGGNLLVANIINDEIDKQMLR